MVYPPFVVYLMIHHPSKKGGLALWSTLFSVFLCILSFLFLLFSSSYVVYCIVFCLVFPFSCLFSFFYPLVVAKRLCSFNIAVWLWQAEHTEGEQEKKPKEKQEKRKRKRKKKRNKEGFLEMIFSVSVWHFFWQTSPFKMHKNWKAMSFLLFVAPFWGVNGVGLL